MRNPTITAGGARTFLSAAACERAHGVYLRPVLRETHCCGQECPMPVGFDPPHAGGMAENSPVSTPGPWPKSAKSINAVTMQLNRAPLNRRDAKIPARQSRNEAGTTDRKIAGQKNGMPVYLYAPHFSVSRYSIGFPRSLRAISTIAVQRKTDRIMAGQNHGEPKQNQGWLTTMGGAV